MSVYNEEQFVQDAIQSILDQTYANFELIIIDDYSTDKSLEICKSFKDSRIRIYSKTNEPRHLAASRNIAIGMAKSEYIINQDADDWSESTRIEKQLLKALENPGDRVVGCSIKRVENGIERIVKLPETHEDIIKGFKRLYNRATIVSGTILAPKKILQEIPYRVRFKYMQDWDHSLRLFESGKVEFYNCQEPLYTYYIRSKGVLFNTEWLDYNIYVRNCQERRKKRLNEFGKIEDFLAYLKKHPFEKIKWFGLKKAIELKLRINQKRS
jgi:glycosyltransferase involved in cell wall biosynthesis